MMGFGFLNYSLLVVLGFAVGLLTGAFGVGGAFLITPALNIIGLDMVSAIGTSFVSLAGKSMLAVWTHYKLGNVDWKLGIIFGSCGLLGVELGKRFLLHLQRLGIAGEWVRVAYVFLLTVVAVIMAKDCLGRRRHLKNKLMTEGEPKRIRELAELFATVITRTPPLIFLPHSDVRLSLCGVVLFGLLIGFLSGFMGVGGGFIGLPLFIYVLGIPTLLAIGTTALSVTFSSVYGTVVYAMDGNVKWVTAVLLIIGSLAGVHIGGRLTKYVHDTSLKGIFSLLLIAVAVSVSLMQARMTILSNITLFCSTACLCLVLLYRAKKGLDRAANSFRAKQALTLRQNNNSERR
jgi:uncharacterized protein